MPRKSNPPITRVCEWCGATFSFRPTPSALLRGDGRFCSRAHVRLASARPRETNPNWRGGRVLPASGYQRAQHWFPLTGQTCAECEVAPAVERHHWDGNPLHNEPPNVVFLCSACHGRLHRQTTCRRGHPLWGDNLYVDPRGGRACRACAREWAAERRRREADRHGAGTTTQGPAMPG